jgi:predicted DNA-binding transcriptional regulator YafY
MAIGVNPKKLNRLRWLDRELARGYYPTLEQLANGLAVCTKTVQRLFSDLQELYQAEIIFDAKLHGYAYRQRPPQLERAFGGVQLAEDDRLHIGLGVKALEFLSLRSAADGLRRWILQVSGESLTLPMNQLDQIVSLAEVRRARVVTADIRHLLLAIQRRCSVQFRYHAAHNGVKATRVVDPYHLTYREAAWYLIGMAHDRQEKRTFALSRMANIQLLGDHHFADPHFNPDQHFHDAGIIQNGERVKVHLVFSGQAVDRIPERAYHFDYLRPSRPYRIDKHRRLHLEFRHSYLEALVPFILSFGRNVRVVAPTQLRTMVRAELTAALED